MVLVFLGKIFSLSCIHLNYSFSHRVGSLMVKKRRGCGLPAVEAGARNRPAGTKGRRQAWSVFGGRPGAKFWPPLKPVFP